MALIVKELNMPTCCDDCEFCIKDWDYKQGFCSASKHIQWSKLMLIPSDHRHLDCPLIEIPKSVRLIDANRLLIDRMKKTYYHLKNGDTAIPIIDIEHAPTIYEEEEND